MSTKDIRRGTLLSPWNMTVNPDKVVKIEIEPYSGFCCTIT